MVTDNLKYMQQPSREPQLNTEQGIAMLFNLFYLTEP